MPLRAKWRTRPLRWFASTTPGALSSLVNELYQHGGTILGIARQLQIGAQTVRKFVRSPQFPEWGKPAVTRSAIDPYRTYLEERWRQGCQDTGSLWRELQARGFTGSRMMVYRWIQVRRDEPASASETGQKQANRAPRRAGTTSPGLAVSA